MPSKIAIAFHADGTIEYTRTKALTLFGGSGTMQRVTDIKKVPTASLYYIYWMLGPHTGHSANLEQHKKYIGQAKPEVCVKIDDNTGTFYFNSYEDAVSHEIEMLNAMRKAGVRFYEQA